MSQAVTLLFGVHAHQPVGNFPEVIEDAHQRCYKPFLETLYDYPDFRFAVHFSGWLLDWLREKHPVNMNLLAEMVGRGQVELFSSGDTEPVLAAILHRDRLRSTSILMAKPSFSPTRRTCKLSSADGLAALLELSSYPLSHNFGDTLRRYYEHYHDKIGMAQSEHQGEGIASAHDILRFKHPVSPEDIVPDRLPRAIFLDQLDGSSLNDYTLTHRETLHFARPGIRKNYTVSASTVAVTWQFTGLADGSIPSGFGQPLELNAAAWLKLEDGVPGGCVTLQTSISARIHGRPQQTVSQSEAGFEKIMRAVELQFDWIIPAETCTLQLQLILEPSKP